MVRHRLTVVHRKMNRVFQRHCTAVRRPNFFDQNGIERDLSDHDNDNDNDTLIEDGSNTCQASGQAEMSAGVMTASEIW